MPTIRVKINIEKDMWNWWNACNKVSHGVDWKMRIYPHLRKKISGKSQKEAFEFLRGHLRKIYQKNNLRRKARELQKDFQERKNEIFSTMEKLTMKKIYRDDFTLFLTTFPRFPYNYKKGFVWISYRQEMDHQVAIFIHELLHFQFMEYYGEKAWDMLGPEKYQYLKEGMTVILNETCQNLTPIQDRGYEIHKTLRKKLLASWRKHKRFDLFFKDALDITKSAKITQ